MMRLINALPKSMLLATVVALAILIGLGTWQIARLEWKTSLIKEMARTEALPPVPVSALLDKGDADWRSVRLTECWIHPEEAVFMHSSNGKRMGFRVLTKCPVGQGKDILVDLGFMPERSLVRPFKITLIGRLRPIEQRGGFVPLNRPHKREWYWRSIADLSKWWKSDLRDDYFLIVDVHASNILWRDLEQAPMTAPLVNRHLEYALTWYGLAVTLLAMVFAFAAQRARKI